MATPRGARYVYLKVSARTGKGVWYGDFRRHGRGQQRLENYRDGSGIDVIADIEAARQVYYHAVRQFRLDDQARAVAADASTAPAPTAPVPAPAPPVLGVADLRLKVAVEQHLARKRGQLSRAQASTCDRDESALANVINHFGATCRLGDLTTDAVEAYAAKRLLDPGHRKETTVSPNTVRNELHALSNLFKKLGRHGIENPVRHVDKPPQPEEEARFLELDEAAAMLDAAAERDAETALARHAMALEARAAELRRARGAGGTTGGGAHWTREERALMEEAERLYPRVLREERAWHRRNPHSEAVVATLFYTGGRQEEVRGLDASEVESALGTVRIQSNRWRRLKRHWGSRTLTLWPEHARILHAHWEAACVTEGLVFPGERGGMMGDLGRLVHELAKRAGVPDPEGVTPHATRHTYATAMLNVTIPGPGGYPVLRSALHVAQLLGHTDSQLVERRYGHKARRPHVLDALSFDRWRRLPSARLADGAPPRGG